MTGAPEPGRRAPKVMPVRDEVARALPRIIEVHGGGHALQLAFPLPGGRREKVLVRLAGLDRPLVLRVYAADEADLLENGNVVTRLLEARRTVPVGHCWSATPPGKNAPFGYRIHDLVWGTDLEKLCAADEIGAREAAEIGEALGDAVAALHEIEADGWGEPRLPAAQRALSPSAFVRAEVARRIERARAAGLLDEAREREIRAFVDLVAKKVDEDAGDPRLVHGGLGLEAALFRREEGRYVLTGLVGLDGARYFDPRWDLAALEDEVFSRAEALRGPFLEAYARRRKAPPPEVGEERAALFQMMRALG